MSDTELHKALERRITRLCDLLALALGHYESPPPPFCTVLELVDSELAEIVTLLAEHRRQDDKPMPD